MSIKMQESTANESKQALNRFADYEYDPELQKSMIADYCLRALQNGHWRCIWLCIRHGKKYNLVDIPVASNGQTIGFADIRKRYGWWKRHSLYSVTGVREVEARVLEVNQKTQRISAVIMAFDVDENIKTLDETIKSIQNRSIVEKECDIDIRGRHQCAGEYCPNFAFLSLTDIIYCRKEDIDYQRQKRNSFKWLRSMLEYYWEKGIDEAGFDFLEDSDFATDYEYLLYNRWEDAANPYGQTINAFLVVEGWNVMLVLRLIGIGVFLTVCIVSIVTAVSHSFEIGLTAGSYAASLLSVMLAVFAFLSLII